MLAGIERWQRDPWRRPPDTAPVVWAAGSSRLLDHGHDPGAPPVVVVPSLINRPYILDLLPDRSVMAALAAGGLRPLLLDWGAPGREERGFGLGDYLTRRLAPALAAAGGGQPPALLGYCMGGTLAALAVLGGAPVSRLATLGAPWAFGRAGGQAAALRAAADSYGRLRLAAQIRVLGEAFGAVPGLVFQQLFALIDPIQAARKFRRFARLPTDAPEARLFVAIEDWLADAVPMAAPAAEELLIGWHLEGALEAGRFPAMPWTPPTAGAAVPALVVTGARDSIARPEVAAPLARRLPGARHLHTELGHVGMITGQAAPGSVMAPVVEFLRQSA